MSLIASKDQLIAEKIEFEVLKRSFKSWKFFHIFYINVNFLIQYLAKCDIQGQFWKALVVQISKLTLIMKILDKFWEIFTIQVG